MSTPDRLTQTEFAGHIGVDKSTVTRLKQAGRLVLDADGRVDVAASIARIEATRGERHDVRQRWEEARRGAQTAVTPMPESEPELEPSEGLDVEAIGKRTRLAQMRKAEAEAEARIRQNAIEAGSVLPKSDLLRGIANAVGVITNAAETLPDRLTPLLTGLTEAAAVRAILRDEVEQFLTAASERLEEIAQRREG